MKKYELLQNDTIKVSSATLYRIRALRDFKGIKAGDLGGYLQYESNLSHEGTCLVGDYARVFEKASVLEDAQVYGNAKIFGYADVSGSAHIFDMALVMDNACIQGNAYVCDTAQVYD